MASKTFTITIETEERGYSPLLVLLTPVNVARALRDFIQESMAPGKGMTFKVTVTDEERGHEIEGVIPSPEEIRARIEALRRETSGK